jgi:hypothetical protein
MLQGFVPKCGLGYGGADGRWRKDEHVTCPELPSAGLSGGLAHGR